MRTLHKQKGQIFCGQNKYCGKVWRDWALIDWGDEGELPCKIWGFVDLRGIPDKKTVVFKEIPLERGIYAVVESALFVNDKNERALSEIFEPIIKEVSGLTNNAVSSMAFLLADVEALVEAIAVIPDIGGPPNAYFWVNSRETWRESFVSWLERPFDLEEEVASDEEDDEVVEESESGDESSEGLDKQEEDEVTDNSVDEEESESDDERSNALDRLKEDEVTDNSV